MADSSDYGLTTLVRSAAVKALSQTREVNGGELESVCTIYTPEGLALLVGAEFDKALTRANVDGYDAIRALTALVETCRSGEFYTDYDASTSLLSEANKALDALTPLLLNLGRTGANEGETNE